MNTTHSDCVRPKTYIKYNNLRIRNVLILSVFFFIYGRQAWISISMPGICTCRLLLSELVYCMHCHMGHSSSTPHCLHFPNVGLESGCSNTLAGTAAAP